jgi:hypothetical protein
MAQERNGWQFDSLRGNSNASEPDAQQVYEVLRPRKCAYERASHHIRKEIAFVARFVVYMLSTIGNTGRKARFLGCSSSTPYLDAIASSSS